MPLRLFDGIPQSTPLRDGSRNGVFTDMDVVGRIEVINGPSAAEGIGAAGGIINYISKDATEPGTEVQRHHALLLAVRGRQRQLEGRRHVAHKSDDFDVVFDRLATATAASPTTRTAAASA